MRSRRGTRGARRTSKHSFGAKVGWGKWNISANYTRETVLEDGVSETQAITWTDGATALVLLAGVSDFNTDAQLQSSRHRKNNHARVRGLSFTGHISPDESATEPFSISMVHWLAVCSAAVATDWTTNSRSPDQPSHGGTTTAQPHRIISRVKRDLITRDTSGGAVVDTRRPTRITQFSRYPFKVHYPDQLYWFFNLEVFNDGTTAGVPSADVSFSYQFKMKALRPNVE